MTNLGINDSDMNNPSTLEALMLLFAQSIDHDIGAEYNDTILILLNSPDIIVPSNLLTYMAKFNKTKLLSTYL